MSEWKDKNEENRVLQKGKQKALKLIFGRTMVIAVLFLIQFAMIVSAVKYFSRYIPVFFGGYVLFGLLIVLIIINKEGSPEVKLSWSIITMMLPVVGGLLYLFVEMQPGYRLLQRKLDTIYKRTEDYVQQDAEVLEALEKADRNTAGLASYVH
ncbi:MAG: PLDc_N domain-containing protein, partial [Anaerotignum sp.]|nr:PLDc_N domain-containing protein [Anaerotignum sp.]